MSTRSHATLAASILLCLLFLPTTARAFASETPLLCSVPGTFSTIQRAVDEATCATVSLAPGAYRENLTIKRAVTIIGQGRDETVIDGGGAGSVVTIARSGMVVLEALTITGGKAPVGAGINNDGAVEVRDGAVSANTATHVGGGIYNGAAGTAYFSRSAIHGNRATFGGGGLWNAGDVTGVESAMDGNFAVNGGALVNTANGHARLENVALRGNEAQSVLGMGGLGGAIYADGGLVSVSSSSFSDNIASMGAALYITAGGHVRLEDCVLITNYAWCNGGSICNAGRLTVQGNIFRHNRARGGRDQSSKTERGIYNLAGGVLLDGSSRREYGWARW